MKKRGLVFVMVLLVQAVVAGMLFGENAGGATGRETGTTMERAGTVVASSLLTPNRPVAADNSPSSGRRRAGAPPQTTEVGTTQVEGTIKAISSSSITVHDSHGTDVVLALVTTTVIRKGDSIVKPADLAVGDQVHVKAASIDNVATAVLIEVQTTETSQELEIEGTIKAVSAASLTVHDAHGTDIVFVINSSTVIRKNDVVISPTVLKVGDQVYVKATSLAGVTTATLVVVRPAVAHALEVEGTIKVVSATSLTVHDSHGADVVLVLTKSTVIRKGDLAITAADLKVGDQVHVQGTSLSDVNTAVLVLVQAEEHHPFDLAGTITAVSTSSVTVRDEHGTSVIFMITGDTIIRRGDTTINAAGLKVGDKAEVSAIAQGTVNTALTIHVEALPTTTTATVSGTVKATGSGQLTVHTSEHGDITVKTDTSTVVRRQGVTIAFNDIHVGNTVTCTGTIAGELTLLAKQIEVSSEGSGSH